MDNKTTITYSRVDEISSSKGPENSKMASPVPEAALENPLFVRPHSPASTAAATPPWGRNVDVHHNVQEPDTKTININIQINFPSNFKLPGFRGLRCRRAGSDGFRRCQGKRKPFLSFLIFIFYASFISCGAAAWSLRNSHNIYRIPHAPLVIATFSPFADLFALIISIAMIRKHQDSDKPSFRYVVLGLMHGLLFILHLVCLTLAAIWVDHGRYWYWSYDPTAVGGLVLYSMSTMILIKFILAFVTLRNSSMRRKFIDSIKGFPSAIMDECEYDNIAQDVDDDARPIDYARPSATEGRVFLC